MSMILASFACLSTEMIYGVLASTILSHCTLKSYRTLKSPFSTTHSGICLYTTDLPVPVKPSHTFTSSFSRNRRHVFSQSTSSMSLTYCPYIFSFNQFAISLFLFFLHSLAFFALFTVTVPLSPTFLSNASRQFLTFQLKFFSSPLTQASRLMNPSAPFFLDRYILAVSLLGCELLIHCHHLPGHPIDLLEFILCPSDHSSTI